MFENTKKTHSPLERVFKSFLPTDDEDEEDRSRREAEVLGRAPELLADVGFAVGGVVEVFAHSVPASLLVHVGRQLHLHVAVVALHVLRQVEPRVRVRLSIELLATKTSRVIGNIGQ